jgi:putative acetyltransferase
MEQPLVIAAETPLQSAVAELLQHSDLVAAELYPGAYRRAIIPESLASPCARVFVARREGNAHGLCVLFDHGDGVFELKRMIVRATARGQGVGAALIDAILAEAQRLGGSWVMLEVGTRNTEAQSLYRRVGFTDRGPFPPYQASPISIFLERRL